MEKKPISKEWLNKLSNGGLLLLAAENKLPKFIEEFPEDMKIPTDVFTFQDTAGWNFLHVAAFRGGLKDVTKMVEKFNINLEYVIYQKDNNKNYFLHHAAYRGHVDQVVDMVKNLDLDLKPILSETDKEGKNILHFAAYSGHFSPILKMSKELDLDLRPLLSQKDNAGHDFLYYAGRIGRFEAAKKFKKDVEKIMIRKEIAEKSKVFKGKIKEKDSQIIEIKLKQKSR